MKKKIIENAVGSSLDAFLEEEDILAEVEAIAAKRVLAYQIEELMKKKQITQEQMAERMHTSRSTVTRLLDPENTSLTLLTIEAAAAAVGKRVNIVLV